MAAPQLRLAGPAYLATSATNIYTPPSSSQVTLNTYITMIWIANTDTAAHTFTLYIGATGGSSGGTELFKGVSIAANTTQPYYFADGRKLAATDFLTGLASTGSVMTITVDGYVVAVA